MLCTATTTARGPIFLPDDVIKFHSILHNNRLLNVTTAVTRKQFPRNVPMPLPLTLPVTTLAIRSAYNNANMIFGSWPSAAEKRSSGDALHSER